MNSLDIPQLRLHNQHLASPLDESPHDMVRRFGAVQAQDYPAARWGVGQRLRSASDSLLDRAYAEGSILRTHVMRPTWHFVAPEDIRWLLALTAPRVHAVNAHMYRKYGVDAAELALCRSVLEKALVGNNYLTRRELVSLLQQAGIPGGDTIRLSLLIMHAELEGLICSGPMRDKQFTYALIEERAPSALTLTRDEALVELASRFFTSHGPATAHDFAWWSGLTVADARAALAMHGSRFAQETIDNLTYYFSPATSPAPPAEDEPPAVHLLPNYDEYTIAYRNHDDIITRARSHNVNPNTSLIFSHVLVINGQLMGTWKRTLNKTEAAVQLSTFAPLSEQERAAVATTLTHYSHFLNLPVTLQPSEPST